MDTNSLSQSLDSVNTAVSVAGEEEVRESIIVELNNNNTIGFKPLNNNIKTAIKIFSNPRNV